MQVGRSASRNGRGASNLHHHAKRGDEGSATKRGTMLNDYTTQSPTSDPGAYAYLFDDLPTDLLGIAQVTQGLIYHYFADQYTLGWQPPSFRLPEINTRTMEKILAALLEKDERPLTAARRNDDRLVGCCRDFALLACAILRHQGRPARLRYGFASYFAKGYWVDHVIVEVWEENRWRRFDPQVVGKRDWGFDMLDLPDAAFWTGGKAWQMARGKVVEADRFGLGPNDQNVRGWWFIRERLQLDLAALNKVELL
ncbi:MAG: transglutaminase domain-containing protein, partial [Caldilineaceae bacterium]|nr:transglutaminase domain-containing protein [Caldilineaceae bacterium]